MTSTPFRTNHPAADRAVVPLRLSPSGRPVPAGYPSPGAVLLTARAADGQAWATPLTGADPRLIARGRPLEGVAPGQPRTEGRLTLRDRDRQQTGTDAVNVLARPYRLVWGDPRAGHARSHVPSFLLTETDGTATVVELVPPGAARAVPGWAVSAWLAADSGWACEVYRGDEGYLDHTEIVWTVMTAPPGSVSEPLREACLVGAPTPAVLRSVTTCADLLTVLPLLRDMAAGSGHGPARRGGDAA